MELNIDLSKNALHWEGGNKIFKLARRRLIVGSGKSCDIIIPIKTISAIHAVLECHDNYLVIFDMNSKNGTFYAGNRVVTTRVNLGDSFYLADQKLVYNVSPSHVPPPILDMLVPKMPLPKSSDTLPINPNKNHRSKSMEGEYPKLVQYPLASDPRALYSEYIFEDVELLKPIFRYEHDFHAVEVIILFNDKIISADYLPVRDASYHLVGTGESSSNLEFAYLPRNEKQLFLDVRGHSVAVYPVDGFQMQYIADKPLKQSSSKVNLNNAPVDLALDDIISFSKGSLHIFVRQTEAPPKVKPAPFFETEKEFKKYLLLFMFIAIFIIAFAALFPVPENKELEEEKAPELVVKILKYKPKPKLPVEKTENIPKEIVQASPVKEIKKPEPVSEQTVKSGKVEAPDAPAKLGSPKVAAVQKKISTVSKQPAVKPGAQAASRPAPKAPVQVKVATTATANKGPVDTFKSIDFSSSLSSVLSKGGQASKVKSSSDSQGFGSGTNSNVSGSIGTSTVIGGSESATVTTATMPEKVGSLTGVTSGTLDASKGLEGVVSKGRLLVAGVPDKIVVLGGMDPDIIDKILRDHLAQFRYCYQKVLDRSTSEFEGRFTINFIIGASGHVSRVAIVKSNLPDNVSVCVENVVKGIQFPEPRGGGVVEVNKPLNFLIKN